MYHALYNDNKQHSAYSHIKSNNNNRGGPVPNPTVKERREKNGSKTGLVDANSCKTMRREGNDRQVGSLCSITAIMLLFPVDTCV